MTDKVAVASPWQIAYRQTHLPDCGAANVPCKAGLADFLAAVDPAEGRQRPVSAAGARVPGVFRAQRKLLDAVSVCGVCVFPLSELREHERDWLCAFLHQRPESPLQGRNRPLSEDVQRAVASRCRAHGGAACHDVRAAAGENGDFLAAAASGVFCAKPADSGTGGRPGGVQQAQIRPVQVHAGPGDAVRRAPRPDALAAGGAARGAKHGVCSAQHPRPRFGQDPPAAKVRAVVCVHYTSHQHHQAVNRNSFNSLVSMVSYLNIPSNEDPSTYVSFPPCAHLSRVLASADGEAVLKTYNTAMKICLLAMPVHEDRAYLAQDGTKVHHEELVRLRAQIVRCGSCHAASNVFMCLECSFVGCYRHRHASEHASAHNHAFGISPHSGDLICWPCESFVSDPSLERIRINQIIHSKKVANFPGMPIFQHEHDAEKQRQIVAGSRAPCFRASTGLKGFVNMGSTCFMSSVLQTLIHNPFIRDYFLAGNHGDCSRMGAECLSCSVADIFQDFYSSPSAAGYGPVSLLTAAWKVKRSLAGYSEQDAHEFWQFLLHQLHKNDTKKSKAYKEHTPAPEDQQSPAHGSCNCIIHRTFAGELQSSIRCKDCRNTTVTVDPMLDLSLEIQEKHTDGSKTAIPSLEACLDVFTKPEQLDATYSCSSCHKQTKVTKQLKIKKLPRTLGIQLKRFEHLATSTKVDTHVQIPLFLNMSDYVLASSRPHYGQNLYELFAVVCHIGSASTGHYICMVKARSGAWFMFNDATVTKVSQQDVLNSRAYLLYYIIHEMA
ncbi:hypothetical protein KL929_003868 [Ogataea haglerorum]|nr:hypothetical protein KL951_004206 [Ogataea haglerorum]KAG7795517.1 hypothetical protein KL929_003868 [Ogataea haglerorum]